MATEFISNSWLMPTNANAEANRVSNYSLDFDGSSQYINCGNDSIFSFSSDMSASAWANTSQTTAGNIFSKTYYRLEFAANGILSWAVYETSSSSTFVYSTTAINDGQWHHIVVTHKANGNQNIYVDGQLDGTAAANTGIQPTTHDFFIGRRNATHSQIMDGNLTTIALWNTELSASQVTELYGTGSAIGNPMAITNGRKPVYYAPLGNAAFNGEFLVPNGAEQDYVFDFLAAPTYSRISLGTSDFIGNKSISFWLNKNVNNGSVFAFGNTNYYPNVQSTTLQLNNGSTTILSTGTINLNEWNHYVITGDGTTAKCYVNGVYKSTGIDRDISSGANWIGGQNNGTGMLNGKLSNIQKWDVVLSDGGVSIGDVAGGDISTLYNYGTPYKGTQPQSANLQAWWELDASATFDGSNWSIPDASSNSNTGTSSGMSAANLILSDLVINQSYDPFSLSFDGSNDYINCEQVVLKPTSAYSISGWFKLDDITGTKTIISNDNNNGYMCWVANDKLWFYHYDTTWRTISSTTTLVADTWYHFALTWELSSTTGKMYINGVYENQNTGFGQVTYLSTPVYIGTYGPSFYFEGKISNCSIYNSALSAAQVTNLYNEGKPFDLNNFAVTPVAWWRLGSVNSSYNSTTSEWTILDEIGTSNGTGSNLGPAQTALSDGVGATGSGLSSGMGSGENRKGSAPFSESNSVSYNMSVLAKSTSVPT